MSETEPTFEERRTCPKCKQPGEDNKIMKADASLPKGTTVHQIVCRTPLCPWENSPWFVQVNPDGSVPPPQNHTGKQKKYVGFEGHDQQAEHLVQMLKDAALKETEPGYEIKRGP